MQAKPHNGLSIFDERLMEDHCEVFSVFYSHRTRAPIKKTPTISEIIGKILFSLENLEQFQRQHWCLFIFCTAFVICFLFFSHRTWPTTLCCAFGRVERHFRDWRFTSMYGLGRIRQYFRNVQCTCVLMHTDGICHILKIIHFLYAHRTRAPIRKMLPISWDEHVSSPHQLWWRVLISILAKSAYESQLSRNIYVSKPYCHPHTWNIVLIL